MRTTLLTLVACALAAVTFRASTDSARAGAFADRAAEAKYTTATWDADTLGNHRVVLKVTAAGDAAWAHIEWRRRDAHPELKRIDVVDAKTGAKIVNVVRPAITRETGDIIFEPTSGPGSYYVYYLPNIGSGRSNYPKVVYPRARADSPVRLARVTPRRRHRRSAPRHGRRCRAPRWSSSRQSTS